MVTYAQLQTEAAWGQEVTTDELDWLVDALCAHFGVPRGNGGTKGDNRHLNGGHRSQRWILTSRYCTSRTYSVEAGLSAAALNDIAAFDVTLPPQHMLTISRNADRATRAGQLEELVEWFGNVDGDQQVDGWNNIENRVASSDSSHLWHFHGRIRRSVLRDMDTMRRVFAALTGGDDDLDALESAKLNAIYNAMKTTKLPGAGDKVFDVPLTAKLDGIEAKVDALNAKLGVPVDGPVLEGGPIELSDAEVERIAKRVDELLAARLAS